MSDSNSNDGFDAECHRIEDWIASKEMLLFNLRAEQRWAEALEVTTVLQQARKKLADERAQRGVLP